MSWAEVSTVGDLMYQYERHPDLKYKTAHGKELGKYTGTVYETKHGHINVKAGTLIFEHGHVEFYNGGITLDAPIYRQNPDTHSPRSNRKGSPTSTHLKSKKSHGGRRKTRGNKKGKRTERRRK